MLCARGAAWGAGARGAGAVAVGAASKKPPPEDTCERPPHGHHTPPAVSQLRRVELLPHPRVR